MGFQSEIITTLKASIISDPSIQIDKVTLLHSYTSLNTPLNQYFNSQKWGKQKVAWSLSDSP